MRPLFVAQFRYDTLQSELERLFRKYGKLDRVEMKSGYAFVYFKDEDDAKRAISRLNNTSFGNEQSRLVVKWAKGMPGRPGLKPTKTLFVFNFTPLLTTNDDIKKHFDPYGKVLDVKMRGKHSFVEFATQEDATKALQATKGSMILGRPLTIKYSNSEISNEDSDHYAASPRREISNERSSPDYSRYRGPEYKGVATSPEYSRRSRTRSPVSGYGRYKNRRRR